MRVYLFKNIIKSIKYELNPYLYMHVYFGFHQALFFGDFNDPGKIVSMGD